MVDPRLRKGEGIGGRGERRRRRVRGPRGRVGQREFSRDCGCSPWGSTWFLSGSEVWWGSRCCARRNASNHGSSFRLPFGFFATKNPLRFVSARATEEKKGWPRVAEGRAIGTTSSMTPLAFMSKIFVTRSLWSWLFEVLPVWLLALQSVVAVSSHGDVDGYSSSPLFGPTLRCGDKWMTSANAKIQTLLGRWSIQERHNIDEFMEGLCIPPAHHPARQILYMHIVVVVHATQGTEKTAHDAPRALMPPPSRQSLFASLTLASRALLHACACLSLLRMCTLPPESPDAHAHPPLDLSRPCRVQPSDSRRGSVR